MIPARTSPMAAIALAAALIAPGAVVAQSSEQPQAHGLGQKMVTANVPVSIGWFNGMPCFYISTDASDQDVAASFQANYSPTLAASANNGARVIYAVTNFTQGNIVPSAPAPSGPTNADRTYTPLWQVTTVTWNAGATPTMLRSEADVLAAQSSGKVTLNKTNIVVNCTIIYTPQGGVLPGNHVNMTAGAKAASTMSTADMPVTVGWYNGQPVLYLSSDASDAGAGGPNANLSTSLATSADTGAVDDIYVVTNFKQGNIIPSAPVPAGPTSTRTDYTPLWQVSTVTWNAGATPHTLKSEADVMAAKADGAVTIARTRIVVNCPVIQSPLGGTMPGVKITVSR